MIKRIMLWSESTGDLVAHTTMGVNSSPTDWAKRQITSDMIANREPLRLEITTIILHSDYNYDDQQFHIDKTHRPD